MTSIPCKRRTSHSHTLTYCNPSRPGYRRRSTLTDRCNSLLFWSTAAWALLCGLEPRVDGNPLDWSGAREYLEVHAGQPGGGLAKRALRMVDTWRTKREAKS